MSRMPASLAIRTNAVLIPVMTYRNDDGIYEVVVDPPIERPVDLDDRTAKEQMMRSFAQILERYLRTDPTQWCWTHRQGWQEGSLAKHSTAQTTNPVNG
jgi:lauroyl/myristoyl acyltransferase